MTRSRTIEIRIADDCKIVPLRKSLQDAVGYLRVWGNSDHVILYIDKDYNVEASHQKYVQHLDPLTHTPKGKDLRQYYFIMGLYDAKTDTYSFHS
jgi:hypothetical protein